MAALDEHEYFVREKIELESWTHKQVSVELQRLYPGKRGFSLRSVELFCKEKGIKKLTDLDDQQLDGVVTHAVLQVYVCHNRAGSCRDTEKTVVILFPPSQLARLEKKKNQNVILHAGWTYIWTKNDDRLTVFSRYPCQ